MIELKLTFLVQKHFALSSNSNMLLSISTLALILVEDGLIVPTFKTNLTEKAYKKGYAKLKLKKNVLSKNF